MALKPWHLWGVSADVSAVNGALIPSQQLVRVDYGRPETWTWFAWLQVNQASGHVNGNVSCVFDVTLGVGRASTTFRICQLNVVCSSGPGTDAPAPFPENSAWAGPGLGWYGISGIPPAPSPNQQPGFETFPAEQINVQGIVGADSGQNVQATIGFFVAPRTHVRPEWWRKIGDFMGELGGR